jgi:hypothetical protein
VHLRSIGLAVVAAAAIAALACGDPAPATKPSASSAAPAAQTSAPTAKPSASAPAPAEERRRSGGPEVRTGAPQVSGKMLHEPLHRVVRQAFPQLLACYEDGLKKNPKLKGRILFDFVIKAEGGARDVKPNAELSDKSVVECATRIISGLPFPKPEGGMVTVTYPLLFSAGDDVNGRPAKDAAQADVEKALADAGATDVAAKPMEGKKGASVVTGKLDGASFTVTVVPAPAGSAVFDAKEIEGLEARGIVYTDEGFFLAVETDKPALLEKAFRSIVKER